MILVVGGASSGKSQRALDLAGAGRPRAFVATGQALDPEMEERITRHQAARAKDWQTVEVPLHLATWFFAHGHKFQSIVLDCLTLWLSNLRGARVPDAGMPDKVAELLEAMRKSSRRVVIVSNELGMGLVPVGRAVRKFRELAGKVNQMVAAEADEVYFVISGQSLRLK
ncbi:MAG: bifunctional adenosylcobinamide kinase/adenosylcobinamide-phosphate guanylyltransferase [Nitrospiraceae bacterium]|nr:bifunctional adenosylcobinamide kinase/adenosylcobinamide-phosphate guanylyltransferase [Nitrospiraceae bacterium]